ncbi:MAG: hypothetical protein CMC70_04740 [Flavobacteriaceae bacterium]|nr:hypothetical protein [Flavobacteriaceae bacterium]
MLRLNPKRTYLIAISASTILAVICVFIYLETNKQLEQELEDQIRTLGTIVVTDFERTVRNNITSLENLTARIEESDGEFMIYFERDAARIMRQHPAIKFIEWIDSDGIIRKIHPLKENQAAYLLDIKSIEYRYSDWIKNSKRDQSNMTSWVDLTQKGSAFLVDVPIYIKGEFYGTVSAGMDFEKQFNDLNKNLENLDIQLVDENGTEFYRFNNLNSKEFPDSKQFSSVVKPIPNASNVWNFQLELAGNTLYKGRDIIQKTVLSYGLLISLIVGFLIMYFLRSRERTDQQISINKTLTQLNQDLEKQKLAAQEASMHKSDFISNMSHEIRTPLNAILGFVEILHAKELLRNERLYLKLMKNSAQNLLSLVNDILDINKIEAGKTVVAKEIFKPSQNLHKIVATYKSQILENKLNLEFHIPEKKCYSVLSDSTKFNQIITNLLSNAIKFTPRGTIEVFYNEYIESNTLIVEITVSDTGVGIPKDKLSSIFKRFVQVENGTRKRHEGGGLGLAITQELVQLLGGTIEVKSEEHKGSSFTITLPLPMATTTTPKNSIDNPVPNLLRQNCLIIDDNRINRMILFNFLQKTGAKVDTVGSGREGLAKLALTRYDIIFMDVHMPDMDGFETTQKILEMNPSAIILGVSADVTLEAIQKAKASGMKDYLTKPIHKETLYDMLNELFSYKTEGA